MTNGFVTVTEKSRPARPEPRRPARRPDRLDRRRRDAQARRGAILDADNDKLDANNSLPDVVGVNITMTAGDNLELAGLGIRSRATAASASRRTSSRSSSTTSAGKWGVLTVTDTASARTPLEHRRAAGAESGREHRHVRRLRHADRQEHGRSTAIRTNGDASLVALNGSHPRRPQRRRRPEHSTDLPNVEANNIDLAAYCVDTNDATQVRQRRRPGAAGVRGRHSERPQDRLRPRRHAASTRRTDDRRPRRHRDPERRLRDRDRTAR